MGSIVKAHMPCSVCGSSDALTVYDDGVYCYSCNHSAPSGEEDIETPTQPLHQHSRKTDFILDGTYQDVPKRALKADICKQYGYSVTDYDGQVAHVANYRDPNTNTIVAQKLRKPGKKFTVLGDGKGMPLFGQHLWRTGGKSVVITEGEIDCLSVAQAFSGKYPVVSLPFGAQSAVKSIKGAYEWLLGFEKIVVCFDMDEPGQKAALEVCAVLPPGKAYIMRMPEGFKDPNEVLVAKGTAPITSAFWEARQWRPDGIKAVTELREDVLEPKPFSGIPYPWPEWNTKIKGFRPGKLVVLTAGSGLGKSTVLREVMKYLIDLGEPVGGMFLEESNEETVESLMGIHLNKNILVDPTLATKEERESAFDAIAPKVWLWDHFGSNHIDSVLTKMRYMVTVLGVRWLFLDHISILVSGMEDGDERKTIDVIMTRLRTFCEETGAGLFLVSHLRRPSGDKGHEDGASVSLGQLRGSHSIAQLGDTVIGLEKNPDDPESNEVIARCLKDRLTGKRGVLGSLYYDELSGRIGASAF